MTYYAYLNDCNDFARCSADWPDLDPRKPYITTNGHGWQESCDNANGGIDVSWAFHQDPADIFDYAAQHFADSFTQRLQLAIDNDDRDPDQLQAIVDLFTRSAPPQQRSPGRPPQRPAGGYFYLFSVSRKSSTRQFLFRFSSLE